MKPFKLLFISALAALSLSACNLDFSIRISSSTSSSSQGANSSSNSSSATGSSSSSANSSSSPQQSSSQTSIAPSDVEKTKLTHNMKSIQEYGLYTLSSAPSVGKAKLLVIPVWFTDSDSFIALANKETVRLDIQDAYFGTPESTGWHSVKSYYEEESKGRLQIDGTVSEWYSCGKSYKSYGTSDTGGNATMTLVPNAVNWYFTNHTDESRKDYDRDGDGYLDGVLLIYACPDYSCLNKSSYDNLWAYCYWLQEASYQSTTNPGPNVFFWASYDFMYSSSRSRTRTGSTSYGGGDTSHCTTDAHTYIHEMGHVFGLDDYYDYGPNKYSHAGGFSMQDYNVGGHDPYSTLALGWTDPYIPTESTTITIGAFQKTHDLILLSPKFNSYGSPFDEYLLLELYTPTGLNAMDVQYGYSGGGRGPSSTGIRLWHVDARLTYCTKLDSEGYPVFSMSNLTSDPERGDSCYGVTPAFSNTVEDEDYGGLSDNYNVLRLVRNNTSAAVHNKKFIANSDLFGNGSSFSMNTYKSQFYNKTKLNSNVELGWSFSVAISGSGE
ncbi:MAG: hypothetical protein K6E59_00405, partial [Bacilli bacterium]|nr:hypothetical protein [Bacilli bacterium]